VATAKGFNCAPIVIAESWSGNLDALRSELHIYIQANPNQVTEIEPILSRRLQDLLPLLRAIA
ncbi:MAG: hypothetical protein ACRD4B_08045, partial [Acidobacteriota bacterium]